MRDINKERLVLRLFMVAAIALCIAGCDKCGDRVKFNAPSVPKACGADADQSR